MMALWAEIRPWNPNRVKPAAGAPRPAAGFVDVRHAPLPHHTAGRSYTVSGYGCRIPSEYMVLVNGRWRRVYVACFGNSGSLYIGPAGNWTHTVDIWRQ